KWYKFDSDELYDEFGNDWEIKLQNQIDLPAWVVNIPREFYDFQDPETGKWDNYDLYLPGLGEVLSGSRREISYERLVYKMERDNVKKENYRILLELSKEKKLKNCAGAGIGIERLIAWISGENNIANVQIFPRLPGKITDL
ncbi:MAG: amino acid--tRNA ligase-related protein, partial [Thermoplasmata archaeon]